MTAINWLSLQQTKDTQQWKEQAKKAQDARELSECTFAPQISKRQGTVASKADSTQPANERLYNMRKKAINKTDKAKEDYEYEKQA